MDGSSTPQSGEIVYTICFAVTRSVVIARQESIVADDVLAATVSEHRLRHGNAASREK